MILKIWDIEKSGQQRKVCTKECDKCGKIEEVRLDVVKIGRKARNQETDFCRKCCYLKQKGKSLPRGKENKNFKHGLSNSGYRLMTIGKGEKVFEHRLNYENFLGRRLIKGELIHHIDGNKTNNLIENLFLFSNEEQHQKSHYSMQRCGYGFLEKTIWFDCNKKIYTLIKTKKTKLSCTKTILDEISNHKEYTSVDKKRHTIYKNLYLGLRNGKPKTKGTHVFLMEKIIGRYLFRNECVHHINGNSIDNSVDNLTVLTISDHIKAHRSLEVCVEELYKRGMVKFNRYTGLYEVV